MVVDRVTKDSKRLLQTSSVVRGQAKRWVYHNMSIWCALWNYNLHFKIYSCRSLGLIKKFCSYLHFTALDECRSLLGHIQKKIKNIAHTTIQLKVAVQWPVIKWGHAAFYYSEQDCTRPLYSDMHEVSLVALQPKFTQKREQCNALKCTSHCSPPPHCIWNREMSAH